MLLLFACPLLWLPLTRLICVVLLLSVWLIGKLLRVEGRGGTGTTFGFDFIAAVVLLVVPELLTLFPLPRFRTDGEGVVIFLFSWCCLVSPEASSFLATGEDFTVTDNSLWLNEVLVSVTSSLLNDSFCSSSCFPFFDLNSWLKMLLAVDEFVAGMTGEEAMFCLPDATGLLLMMFSFEVFITCNDSSFFEVSRHLSEEEKEEEEVEDDLRLEKESFVTQEVEDEEEEEEGFKGEEVRVDDNEVNADDDVVGIIIVESWFPFLLKLLPVMFEAIEEEKEAEVTVIVEAVLFCLMHEEDEEDEETRPGFDEEEKEVTTLSSPHSSSFLLVVRHEDEMLPIDSEEETARRWSFEVEFLTRDEEIDEETEGLELDSKIFLTFLTMSAFGNSLNVLGEIIMLSLSSVEVVVGTNSVTSKKETSASWSAIETAGDWWLWWTPSIQSLWLTPTAVVMSEGDLFKTIDSHEVALTGIGIESPRCWWWRELSLLSLTSDVDSDVCFPGFSLSCFCRWISLPDFSSLSSNESEVTFNRSFLSFPSEAIEWLTAWMTVSWESKSPSSSSWDTSRDLEG